MEGKEEQALNGAVETLRESIGFKSIEIHLDHSHKVFNSGHDISGNVYLSISEPVHAFGIRVKCKGEAQVYFTDRSAGIRRKFYADETYIHKEIYLAGDGKKKSVVTGGCYPFSFKLPENLPGSFEGRYGRVRYSIRALLDITKVYRFSTNIIPFTVSPILDLNLDTHATLPASEQQSKIYVGQTEPINLSMSLPVRGFVPGQTIPIKIIFKNSSGVLVTKLRIVFKKVVTYRSTEKSRKHKEIVVEIEQQVEKDTETYDVIFDVPAVPPTGMVHCKIINVMYTLKVESCVDVSEWYYRMFQKNLKLRTGIIIGTVPLKNYQDPQGISNVLPSGESTIFEGSQELAREMTKFAAPVYEKSQIYRSSKPDKDDPTGDDGDSDGEVKPYSPMYRVYKFGESKTSVN
ncbi:arrestin domain-containing protein 17-like [Prorops nasuta]|uniref:arrestin domain-containing protein 17-like n=1 Tax=Prorops nasuta TaxID=863751 RepID=UPI0034CF6B2D